MTRTFYRQYSVFKVQTSYEASLCQRAFGDLIKKWLYITITCDNMNPYFRWVTGDKDAIRKLLKEHIVDVAYCDCEDDLEYGILKNIRQALEENAVITDTDDMYKIVFKYTYHPKTTVMAIPKSVLDNMERIGSGRKLWVVVTNDLWHKEPATRVEVAAASEKELKKMFLKRTNISATEYRYKVRSKICRLEDRLISSASEYMPARKGEAGGISTDRSVEITAVPMCEIKTAEL